MTLSIFSEALPSPNGEVEGRVGGVFKCFCRASRMLFFLTPTILENPALTASGLSVESLKTSTGFLILGAVASSWIPPESVRITWQFFIRIRKSK